MCFAQQKERVPNSWFFEGGSKYLWSYQEIRWKFCKFRIHVCTINHIICLLYVLNVFIFFCQREQLAGDIQDANDSAIMSFPDVSAWPIVPYDMPQQEDGWVTCSMCFSNTLSDQVLSYLTWFKKCTYVLLTQELMWTVRPLLFSILGWRKIHYCYFSGGYIFSMKN